MGKEKFALFFILMIEMSFFLIISEGGLDEDNLFFFCP